MTNKRGKEKDENSEKKKKKKTKRETNGREMWMAMLP